MQKKKKVVKKVEKKVSKKVTKKVPVLSYKLSVRFTAKEGKSIAKLSKKLKMSNASVVRAFVGEGLVNHQ